jgi:hypothetical protein
MTAGNSSKKTIYMKNFFKIILISLFFMGCSQKIDDADIAKLNGYWEIEKVVTGDGTKKDFNVNETIDYFEVKNNTGFRKKVAPQLDGRYLVNDQLEKIKIIEKEGKTYVSYITPYAKWREQIVEISQEKLILKNDQNTEYQYKRQIPFSVK